MFQEPLSSSASGSIAAGSVLSHISVSTSGELDLVPPTLDQLSDLKRQYAALLIQLDHLRPVLASADVVYRNADNEWSIKEILGHLIDSDRDIWWPRIFSLIERDGVPFSDVDQDDLIAKHHWQSLPIEDILAQLMRVRWDYAMKLNAIPEALFDRSGKHPVMGDVSMLQILQLLVAHDAHYVEKIRGLIDETRNGVSH